MGEKAANYIVLHYAVPLNRPLTYFSAGTVPASPAGLGDYIGYYTRFETLYDMAKKVVAMQETVIPGGYPYGTRIESFGWDIVQTSETASKRLLLRFMEPRDRHNDVIFGTELGNVKSFHFEERAPPFNDLFISGPSINGRR